MQRLLRPKERADPAISARGHKMLLIVEAQAALKRKFSPTKQRLLDKLLDRNAAGKLRPMERKQLEQLTAEYGEGLVDKARARYIVELARRAAFTNAEPS